MKNLELRNQLKKLTWPIIIGLLAVIGFVFIKPKITAIKLLRQEQVKGKQMLAQLTEKVLALEGLDEVELEEKTEKLLKALPASKDIPGLLMILKVLGQQTGVVVKEIQVSPGELSTRSAEIKTTGSDLPFLAFDFTAEAENEKLRDFLDKVKITLPLMRIRTLNLEKPDEGLAATSINLESFYLLLPVQLGAVESPLPVLTDQEEKAYQVLAEFKVVEGSEELPYIPSGKENPFTF